MTSVALYNTTRMKHTHRILAVVLIILCVVAIVFLLRERANPPAVAPVVTPTTNSVSTSTTEVPSATTYKDLMKDVVVTPVENRLSPYAETFSVKGEARGPWFFEGTFPVELVDANGTSVATGQAKAVGEWMTMDFVPFTVSIDYPPTKTKTGFLVLKKDNPSGDPSKDDAFKIPVTFASVQ